MHNEQFRFGSASWSGEDDFRRAGMIGDHGSGRGQLFGYMEDHALRLDTDAPTLIVGGAGSGKMRDILGGDIIANAGERNMIVDPRGEIGAVTQTAFAFGRAYAWYWNRARIAGLPQHACNPLDILKLDDPRLPADARFIAEGLIPVEHQSNGRYFSLRANDWGTELIKSLVERFGYVTFPMLYRIVNTIESDYQGWADHAECMLGSRFDSVRRTAGEMLAKQQDAPREFGGIIGELYNALSPLADPMLQAALEKPDFSLSATCDRQQPATIFLNCPMEYMGIWAPILRVIFTVQLLYKMRAPDAPRLNMTVDEAGQLGSFDALLKSFTFGRGAGVRARALFQDIGQIVRGFGQPGIQGFMGSAALRQFFGVRDFQTAQLVSSMLGTETLEYDDTLRQSEARRAKFNAAMGVLNGADPFTAFGDMRHSAFAQEHRTKQARALMTPDEVLAMPEDEQVVFISGKNLKPARVKKYPYYTRPEFAGRFLPNPYHPPYDSVPIPTWRGVKRARVVRERVPSAFAYYPQYASGEWTYVEGFRPR